MLFLTFFFQRKQKLIAAWLDNLQLITISHCDRFHNESSSHCTHYSFPMSISRGISTAFLHATLIYWHVIVSIAHYMRLCVPVKQNDRMRRETAWSEKCWRLQVWASITVRRRNYYISAVWIRKRLKQLPQSERVIRCNMNWTSGKVTSLSHNEIWSFSSLSISVCTLPHWLSESTSLLDDIFKRIFFFRNILYDKFANQPCASNAHQISLYNYELLAK